MIVIAASRPGYDHVVAEVRKRLNTRIVFIRKKADLTPERLAKLKPDYVFFVHWSHIIPAEIHDRFDCVIFHMTDVPFGRGGSPLQNLIVRGLTRTKLTALKCTAGLDAGPVYLKKPLTLEGRAEDILHRMGSVAARMIVEIVRRRPTPKPQTGRPVLFKRRRPEDGNLAPVKGLSKLYDFVRMLDATGYPSAFLETPHARFEFTSAVLKKGELTAHVKIIEK